MSFVMLWENRRILFGNVKMVFTLLPKLLFWMSAYYFWYWIYCLIAKEDEYEEDFLRLVRIKKRIADLILRSQLESIVNNVIPSEFMGRTIDKSKFEDNMENLKR